MLHIKLNFKFLYKYISLLSLASMNCVIKRSKLTSKAVYKEKGVYF